MTTTPVVLILLVAGALGIIMFLKFLRGERNGGGMIATHLILGAAGLEQIALLFRGAPNGETWPSEPILKTGGALIALAMALGFAAALLRSETGVRTLYIHVGAGALGILLILAWVVRT